MPGFRPGRAPSTARREAVPQAGRRPGQVDPPDGLPRSSLTRSTSSTRSPSPSLDVEAIELPDDGPMTFEMEVEVRPDFPLPAYKALSRSRARSGRPSPRPTSTPRSRRSRSATPSSCPNSRAGRGRRLRDGRPGRSTTTARRLQRGQGNPVPAPVRASVPGRHGPRPRQGPGRRQARRDRVSRRQDRLGLARPGPSRQDDPGHLQRPRPQDPPAPRARRGVLPGARRLSTTRPTSATRSRVLERRYEFQRRQAVRNEMLGKLIAETPFDLPADLVSRQEKSTLRRLALDLRQGA